MKKGITKDVLKFMESTDTSEMNTNEFIVTYINYSTGRNFITEFDFLECVSFESLLRSRRKIIADYGIGKRTHADSEQSYIDEYGRKNKIHVI